MSWTKDTTSRAPKTVYVASGDLFPQVAMVFDPDAVNPWSVEYAWLSDPAETQETIEALMGL